VRRTQNRNIKTGVLQMSCADVVLQSLGGQPVLAGSLPQTVYSFVDWVADSSVAAVRPSAERRGKTAPRRLHDSRKQGGTQQRIPRYIRAAKEPPPPQQQQHSGSTHPSV
jgi:hypothetical protein